MAKRVGVMGGTFNPIHIGHLLIAQVVLEMFNFDHILFIPNGSPPHRKGELDIASGEDRYNMVVLATVSNPKFFVSRMEIDREGCSYTYDTLRELKKSEKGTLFSFITGADSIIKDNWYRFDDVLGMLENFVVVSRPGFDESMLEDRKRCLKLKNEEKIKIVNIPPIHISSTMIRERVRLGKSIKYLVPEEVEMYIKKKKLYVSQGGEGRV